MLTAAQAAEILRMGVERVRQLCSRGRIPGATKFADVWQIPESEVRAFAERERRPGWPRGVPRKRGGGGADA